MNDAQYKLIVDAARERGATFPTQADWLRFKVAIDAACGVPRDSEGPQITVCHGLADAPAFFAHMRSTRILGPTLTTGEVQGCEAILKACAAVGWSAAWTAYALATAYHETAGTMQPIREYGKGKGRKYGVAGPDGQIAYGRGYVQLTWPVNYARADTELLLAGQLVRNYDLALDHDIAAQIMVQGMAEGWFTGKALQHYLPDATGTLAQFIACRPIINGRDKDRLIAGYAVEFQKALLAGGWQ